MATPTAAKNCPPLIGTGKAAFHQAVRLMAAVARPPSYFTPTPVATELKGGILGNSYSETISAQGGTAPYTFSVTSGALPTGTTLAPSTGIISGTLTATGTFSFTITVTDVNGNTGSRGFQVIIAAAGYNFGFSS